MIHNSFFNLQHLHKRLFTLLLLLLPTQLGFHFWPEWAFVLGRRVDYLAPTIYLTDILVVCLLASWIIKSQKKFLIYNFHFLIKQRNLQFSIFKLALVLSFAGVNIFFAASRPVAIYKWMKLGEFVVLAWYIIKTKPSLSAISYPLSAGVLFSSLFAIAQFFLQRSIGGPLWFLGERTFTADTPGIARIALNWDLGPVSPAGRFGAWDFGLKLRPYATFPHPNVLGGFLAVLLPLMIYKLTNLQINKFTRWKRSYYLTTLVLGMIALVLTFSRSAWIAGGLAIALTIAKFKVQSSLAWPPGQAKFKVAIQISKIFLLTFLVLGFWFLIGGINPTEESWVVRSELNVAAVKIWQQSPLFGVGLGNFLTELPQTLPSREIYFLQPAHNIYLLILAETGVVGLLIFVWLIYKVIRKHELGIMNYGKNRNFSFIIRNSLFIILLLGLVDHYPLTLQQGQLLLTLFLGLALP
ncbi:MAG: O-antigen ligase family protein [Patescibacteria group bacterium]